MNEKALSNILQNTGRNLMGWLELRESRMSLSAYVCKRARLHATPPELLSRPHAQPCRLQLSNHMLSTEVCGSAVKDRGSSENQLR